MRVCPKCGYIDPAEWKHVTFSYYIDSCRLQEFQKLEPSLYTDICHKKIVEDSLYVYRLAKKGIYVNRKAKIDYGYSYADKTEKTPDTKGETMHLETLRAKNKKHEDSRNQYEHFHPNQKKLFEIDQK